jgi:putative transposase
LRQAIEEIFRGLQQELGWTGHRHWRRARLLAHLALGLVAYGLIERQREGLGLSFYQCRRRLIAGKLSLDLRSCQDVCVSVCVRGAYRS